MEADCNFHQDKLVKLTTYRGGSFIDFRDEGDIVKNEAEYEGIVKAARMWTHYDRMR